MTKILSLLRDFEMKKADVKRRLAKNFACFTRVGGVGYIITGGDEDFLMFQSINCVVMIIGHSSGEIQEGQRIVKTIASRFAALFSERDLHSAILGEYLTQYMKYDLEDKDNSRGLAVEFMIVDFLGRLTMIYFTGNSHSFNESDIDGKILVTGCYDQQYRRRVTSSVSKSFSSIKKPSKARLEKAQKSLKEDLGTEQISILVLEPVTTSNKSSAEIDVN